MAPACLVDTSVWVEGMRRAGDTAVRARLDGILRQGRTRLCDWVLLELWNGVGGEAERGWLRNIELTVDSVSITPGIWDSARDLARTSRESGLTVPAGDLLVFACARVHGLELVHCDNHFDLLSSLGDRSAQA